MVSIFLESLINKKLHAALFAMKHEKLALFLKDAIELDENFMDFNDKMTKRTVDTSSLTTLIGQKVSPSPPQRVPTMQEVANEILH